jgi:phosphoglycolate phosphatase-like HAD superfamily hydrolase
MIRCLILDLDGTLLDRPETLPRHANLEALRTLSSGDSELQYLRSRLRQVSDRVTFGKAILASKKHQFELLLETLGVEDSSCERLLATYMGTYLAGVSLYPEVPAFLDSAAANFRIGLMTNGPHDVVIGVLEHFGISQCFDFVATASLTGFPKPSESFSRHLLTAAGHDPRAVLMVGDGVEDHITAKIAATGFCFVDRSGRNRYTEDGVRTVRNLGELLQWSNDQRSVAG